jgi:hypothetical protein
MKESDMMEPLDTTGKLTTAMIKKGDECRNKAKQHRTEAGYGLLELQARLGMPAYRQWLNDIKGE